MALVSGVLSRTQYCMSCSPYKNIVLGLCSVTAAWSKKKIHTATAIMVKVAQCFAVKNVIDGYMMSAWG